MALAPEPDRSREVYDDVAILGKVATSVNQLLDLQEILHTGMDETMKMFGVNVGGIYIFDEENQILSLKLYHNFTKPFVERLTTIQPGQGCAGTVLQTGEIFAEIGERHRFICKDAEELMGLDCLVASPIKSKGHVIGVMELFAPFGRNLTEREAKIVTIIGDFLGTAIDNARIHEKLAVALKNSEVLLEASQAMSESLKLEDILIKISKLVKRITGLKRDELHIYDREKDELVLYLLDNKFIKNGPRRKLSEIGESVTKHIKTNEILEIYDIDQVPPFLQKILRDRDVKSFICVPLLFQNRLAGLMSLDNPGEKHLFTLEEKELARAVGRYAAAAIENALSFESQRKIADTLQQAFMPKRLPKISGAKLSSAFRTATKEPGIVGGDFFDFVESDKRQLGFIIGDVSGKGIEATSIAAMVKNTIQVFADQGSPGRVLSLTNQFVSRNLTKSQFVTAFYGILYLDSPRFLFSSAGHMPPIRVNPKSKKPDTYSHTSLPLGVLENNTYEDFGFKVQDGDFLFLYTDGATDARSNGNFFGEDRLVESTLKHCSEDKDILKSILKDILNFCGNIFADDIAMVGIKVE